MIMYTVDPEIIILGGSVSHAFKYYSSAMWSSIMNSVYPKSAEKIRIEVSDLRHGAILGSAALCYDAAGSFPGNYRYRSTA
jgi:glucokinase